MANNSVMTRKAATWFTICQTKPGNSALIEEPTADRPALKRSDTNSKKAVPKTIDKERKRSLIKPQIPRPGLGATCQTVFSASCNCPKTPAALEQEGNKAQNRCPGAPAALVSLGKHLLQRVSDRLADGALDLINHFSLGGVGAEDETGCPNDENDERADGKSTVIGEGRTQARRLIFRPLVEGVFEETKYGFGVHGGPLSLMRSFCKSYASGSAGPDLLLRCCPA